MNGALPVLAIGGIRYESNSFARFQPSDDLFEEAFVHRGEAVVAQVPQNSELLGFIEHSPSGTADLVGLVDTFGGCGAPVPHRVYVRLRDELLERLRAREADGVYLALHGAMTTDELDDVEGDLLAHVRDVIGPQRPLVVSFDLHAAVSDRTAQIADAIVGFKTCPHTDYPETGARSAALLRSAVLGEASLRVVRTTVPMLTPAEAHDTNVGPLAQHMRSAQELVARLPAVLDVSIFAAQPWLDTSRTTWTVTVTYDGAHPDAEETANHAAAAVADRLWADRNSFRVDKLEMRGLASMLQAELATGSRPPVLVADSGDSPSAGADGTSSHCLQELLGSSPGPVLATWTNEGLAAACAAGGPGSEVEIQIGEGEDRDDYIGTVRRNLDGVYEQTYPAGSVCVGPTSIVEVGEHVLVVTSRPAMMLDTCLLDYCGIDPGDFAVVQVKSAGGFRALWAGVSERTVVVDSLGASSSRLTELGFSRLTGPLWPFDPIPESASRTMTTE